MATQSETEKIEEIQAEDHSPTNGPAAEAGVPDFTAEWDLVKADMESAEGLLRDHAAVALHVGQTLIKIRDVLKPRKLWLKALEEHGISQPQASRYIRFAEMPERDREVYQRLRFSLSEAIRERRSRPKAGSQRAAAEDTEAEIPDDERCDRLAEVEQRRKLAFKVVEAGLKALREQEPAEYADDDERWHNKLSEVVDAVLAVLDGHLEEELRKRLLPGRS